MSKEEQIEEIANDLRALDCLQHNPNHSIEYQRAIGLYSLGYRKNSEVAEEIFTEIYRLFDEYWFYHIKRLYDEIVELKKKYVLKEANK